MLEAYAQRARYAARRTAFSLFAAILFIVGLVFLSIALWLVLVELRSPTFAALVMGGGFVGLSLIVFAIAAIQRPRRHLVAAPPTNAVTIAALIEAFTIGMGAARARRHGEK